MKEQDLYSEISSIRTLMERSTRFISLSGLSGIMAGIYAIIGAAIAYKILYLSSELDLFFSANVVFELFGIAFGVLILSIGTGIWLTIRKARKRGQGVWNQSSKSLLKSGSLPLLTGGCFILILFFQGYFAIIASGCLIFYGLALVAASQHTFGDVKWLGICEIVLGLLAALFPGFGLFFWAVGFGVLHIIYGTVMYFKYDREDSAG